MVRNGCNFNFISTDKPMLGGIMRFAHRLDMKGGDLL